MARKSPAGMKDLENGSKLNSSLTKVYSTKSILSYQNGSASNVEAGICDLMDSSHDKMPEEASPSDSPPCGSENLNGECLDLLRKKLISDLSLQVFCTDLESEIIKMEPMEINKERLSIIQKLLVQISQLSDAEKLLLYLKLPSYTTNQTDPLRQPLNPLGNRQEIQQTIVWIKTHLEEDREISIPKQDVYDQYLKYCENVSMKPLSTADFGKVMKQVYPGVRPRRLGTRGNSRYCYSGMRNTLKLPAPRLPELVNPSKPCNGVAKNGSSSTTQDSEKCKKPEKSKRKWKTSTGRNSKISPSSRSPKLISKDVSQKFPKRSKVENSVKENEALSEVSDNYHPKTDGKRECEKAKLEESVSSVKAFDDILDDLGICFESKGDVTGNDAIKSKVNLDFFNKMDLPNGEVGLQLNGISKIYISEKNEVNKERPVSETKRMIDKLVSENDVKGKSCVDFASALNRSESKSQRTRIRKSNSCTKSVRNFTKTYVPIQPKPVSNSKPKVHFELDPSAVVSLRRPVGKKENDATLCEESDSQEPEEEIVRYFRQQLEDKSVLGVMGNVDNSVQITCSSQNVIKPEEGRSQSCFESQSKVSKPVNPSERFCLPQRSRSSVDFSGEHAKACMDRNANYGTCDREKISHFRLLLENSIVAEKEIKNTLPGFDYSGQASNAIFSSPLDRKSSKLESQKVTQSPNISTKYFNFTPISPGSQSPLKTPTTPLTSPFVSPRDTPVPRSRQNSSQNDHFLPPAKSVEVVRGFICDNDVNKSETNLKTDEVLSKDSDFPECQKSILPIRPRSNSSTNFYRAKAKRSLSKVLSCDRVSFKEPNPSCGRFFNNNLTLNSGMTFPSASQNVVMNDSLASEIRHLLENDSRVQEATSRSQSVPLNRMISEGSWFSHQASSIYNHYVASENAGDRAQLNSGEFAGFETKSLDAFIPDEEMSLNNMNEVFARETQEMSYQMFDGGFESTNGGNNNDNSFNQNTNFLDGSCFPEKIDLTTNASFPGTFPTESEDMKPYLSNFENAVDKVSPPDARDNLKLFNNSLYDGVSDNAKDPVITSFKPVFMGEYSSCPNSPVLGFFGSKRNDDNQLIEFLGLDG